MSEQRPTGPRILIAGYYGFGNIGDEAILAGLISGVRETLPGAAIAVLSGTPERTKTLHGVEAVLWNDVEAMRAAVAAADVLVVGGGGLFADYWALEPGSFLTRWHGSLNYYAALPLLARAYRKRCVIVGVGVGPLASEEGKRWTRLALAEADRVVVREAASKALAVELGVASEKISVAADPAFLFAASGSSTPGSASPGTSNPGRVMGAGAIDALLAAYQIPNEKKFVAVALRRWARPASSTAANAGTADSGAAPWERAVAAGLDLYLAGTDRHAVFVPFQKEVGADEDDVAVARRVREAMKENGRATVLNAPLSPDVTAALLARADAVLAMRFHAAVFALAANIQPAALAYDPKVARLLDDAGSKDALLPLDALSPDRLAAALQASGKKSELASFSDAMRARAALNIRAIEEAAALPPPADDPVLHLYAEELIARGAAYQKLYDEHQQSLHTLLVRDSQVASLKKDVHDITASNTYKLAEQVRDLTYKAVPKGTQRQSLMKAALKNIRQAGALGVRGTAKKYLPAPIQEPLIAAYHQVKERAEKDRRGADRAQLWEILREHRGARDIWVLAPSIPWDVALFQRPQQLAMALARLNVLLFYVDPSPKPGETGFLKLQDRIYISRVDRDIFTDLENFTSYVLSWNKSWTERLRPARILYDFIDDLDVFGVADPEKLKRDHETLLREATVVSATADLLWREVSATRKDAILCANGVDYEHFARAKDPALEAPDDLADIWALGKPVIGYYGAIARWFDYELLWAVASRRPDLFFLLIGPDYDKTLTDQSLFGLPNVRWVGPRHYSVLPKYLKKFDVATIPFKLNAITHATSPLKLFEYMAGGKPIVTTPMKESMRYENVLVGEGPDAFSAKLSEALSLRADPAHLALTERLARENTWDARAEQLLRALGR